MGRYIALLRGINVGGKNKIAMPLLRQTFEEFGFTEVVTYINSGNVVFSSDCLDKTELIKQCEAAITSAFSLTVPVNVISASELAKTLKHAPDWWGEDKDIIHYAIFLIPPISMEEVFDAVGAIKPEYERIAHHKRVIYWSAPAKTFAKSRWSKIASSTVNNHVTIRNANTVNKLVKLSQ
ncbi:DUF1697 domain-containing protein [Enterococcus pallens]|uniref:DUF1697 domain-containing protein n=1 Tax=Enterococcus pallens ATCC BAA-351 TaxID=1158607 RepID=R2QRT2_9ENTE|nr:DUF1697 domain-containing protein [Enterococcus pallens]EOH97898.1 hypothetical protein UAU_00566 [Enterococcus pallens ATCC BAA-351]EOU20683.1 hypothetical protein I588_01530 [Enterococcus pallens ATCC BAA-351]OJG79360.1 hypothetical protein RV10_GL000862 [Enterococcus pallens]